MEVPFFFSKVLESPSFFLGYELYVAAAGSGEDQLNTAAGPRKHSPGMLSSFPLLKSLIPQEIFRFYPSIARHWLIGKRKLEGLVEKLQVDLAVIGWVDGQRK